MASPLRPLPAQLSHAARTNRNRSEAAKRERKQRKRKAARASPRCRAGGRRGAAHWELTPSAAGLRVLTIKLRQQYETPAAVVEAVRGAWAPDFDAMATPFSAIAPDYATLERAWRRDMSAMRKQKQSINFGLKSLLKIRELSRR